MSAHRSTSEKIKLLAAFAAWKGYDYDFGRKYGVSIGTIYGWRKNMSKDWYYTLTEKLTLLDEFNKWDGTTKEFCDLFNVSTYSIYSWQKELRPTPDQQKEKRKDKLRIAESYIPHDQWLNYLKEVGYGYD
mgnify:CR=1 FL=1